MTETISRKKTSRSAAAGMAERPMKLWQDDSNSQEVRIEIIPLIDVIFCILTFFILAAVGFSRQQAISLDLPKASTGKPQMREMLVVSLDDFAQVYVEQQVVTRNQLYQAIKNYHQFNPNGLMVLHASRNASYNEVIEVLDMLREVGGERVALATLSGESQQPANLNPYSDGSSNNLSPYGTQLPGGSFNPVQPNFPLNPSQRSGSSQFNPLNPLSPGVPTAPSTTPEK
ncbi:MAG: ExbD/TolR family protein [Xenococcaceae cyanobacterium]